MASILDQQIFILEKSTQTSLDENEEEQENITTMSVWVKDKDIIRASTDISLMSSIDPGVYIVDFNRDQGLFCKKIDIKSDELFIFSDSITTDLLAEISLFWDKAELYKANKLIHKRGILLEGFPGTGKSSIISILSNEIIAKGGVVFKINGYRNLDNYIDFVRTSFRKIQPDTPVITILEDLDQYEDVEIELLDFLDGKTHLDHHVIIATTNNTEIIPDTFLRPSRIDLKIEIPLPAEKTRKEYFEHKNVPESDINLLVEKSDGFSLADLKELYICIYLLGYSIDDAIEKITLPKEKKNYLSSPLNKVKLGV
jgi:hypothetical protein